MITGSDEQFPVATMGYDVVNIGGRNPEQVRQVLPAGPGGTAPAERLAQELRRPQIIPPDRQGIPGVPDCSCRTTAGYISRAVPGTVHFPGQLSTPSMGAGPKGSFCHGYTSREKRKDGQGQDHHDLNAGRLKALFCNIHSNRFPALAAVKHQSGCVATRHQASQEVTTSGTNKSLQVCSYFTTRVRLSQSR